MKSSLLPLWVPCAAIAMGALAQPTVTQQPTGQSVSLGATVSFTVTAFGVAPLAYQWQCNEQLFASATNRTLSLTNVTLAHAGDYVVHVTDANGLTATSRVATLEVDPTFTKITTGAIVTDLADHEGVAWVDYDNDGWLDLFACTAEDYAGTSLLYRNNRDGTFTRMSAAQVGSVVQIAKTEDCAWADFDNDGFLDVFVTIDYGPGAFHRNNGDGTFSRVTQGPMLAANNNDHRGVAWADFDADGFVDLFVSSGPRGGGKNALYKNNGDGTFSSITNAPFNVGTLAVNCVWGDYNNDGRPDLFVAGSSNGSRNHLYRNDGNGNFTLMTVQTAGAIVSAVANSAAWADYDNDGDLDLFATVGAFGSGVHLLRNEGSGVFTRITAAPFGADRAPSVTGAWGDYDNDGDLDLFVANYNSAVNYLYRYDGNGAFTRVTSGSPVNDANLFKAAYSCAWGDYDNDGFLDLVVTHVRGNPKLLYRNTGNGNGWLKVKCVGTRSNRAAIGAKVRVCAAIGGQTVWQGRDISGGGGFGGQNVIAHFGLGDAPFAERVRVEWPSGQVSELTNVAARQQLTLVEEGDPVHLAAGRSGNEFALTLRGYRGVPYVLERSTDLWHWSAITNLLIRQANGTVSHREPLLDGVAAGFFRARPAGN